MPAKKLNDLKQTDEERIANEIFDAQKNTLCFRFLRRAVLFFPGSECCLGRAKARKLLWQASGGDAI